MHLLNLFIVLRVQAYTEAKRNLQAQKASQEASKARLPRLSNGLDLEALGAGL